MGSSPLLYLNDLDTAQMLQLLLLILIEVRKYVVAFLHSIRGLLALRGSQFFSVYRLTAGIGTERTVRRSGCMGNV